jgi:hypothetical protein
VDKNLVISPGKCTYSIEKVEFLGYVIASDGMELSEDKLEVFNEWQAAKSLRDVQSILGFGNFYAWFFKNVSKIYGALTESTNGVRMDWGWMSELEESFEVLKD